MRDCLRFPSRAHIKGIQPQEVCYAAHVERNQREVPLQRTPQRVAMVQSAIANLKQKTGKTTG